MGNLQRKRAFFEHQLPLIRVLTHPFYPACVPLPLHLAMAQGPIRLSARQQGLGVPEIRSLSMPNPMERETSRATVVEPR